MKPCAADEAIRSSSSGGVEVRRRVERGLVEAGLEPRRQRVGVPVGGAGEPPQRDARVAEPGLPVPEHDVVGVAVEHVGGDRAQLRRDLRAATCTAAAPTPEKREE